MIRPFRPADRDALLELTARAFDGVSLDQNIEKRFGQIAGTNWQQRKCRHIEADIAAEPQGILVYELDGTVVGFVSTRTNYQTCIGWIPNLAVHPGHQGKGIGKKLLAAALERLRKNGMLYARIETLEQNTRCLAFYPSMGFQEIGRQVHYIKPLGPGD